MSLTRVMQALALLQKKPMEVLMQVWEEIVRYASSHLNRSYKGIFILIMTHAFSRFLHVVYIGLFRFYSLKFISLKLFNVQGEILVPMEPL